MDWPKILDFGFVMPCKIVVICDNRPTMTDSDHIANIGRERGNFNMVRHMKISLAVLGMVTAIQAAAEVAQPADSNPDAWSAKWEASRESGGTENIAAITRVIVVQKVKNEFKIIPMDASEIASATYFDTPKGDAINLALEVNKKLPLTNPQSTNPCLAKIEIAASCLNADGVLDVSDKIWKLYQTSPANNAAKLVAKGPAGSINQVAAWLTSQMNHDGVVLETKNSSMLVRMPLNKNTKQLQALTLDNSADEFVLPAESKRGSGIWSSVSINGHYGIFKILTGQNNPPPGTKVIMEKGNVTTNQKPKS